MTRWAKHDKKDEPKKATGKPDTKSPDATPPARPSEIDDYGRTGEYRLPTEDDATVVEKLDAQLAAELSKRDERQVELQELIQKERSNAATTAELAGQLRKNVEMSPPGGFVPSTEGPPKEKRADPVVTRNAPPPPEEPKKRFCSSCGNLIPLGATVCTVDGTEQTKEA